MNEVVIADHLSLVDDGLMEGYVLLSRDDEGVPSRTQTIVNSGRLTGELWSTRDAAKLVSEGKVESAKQQVLPQEVDIQHLRFVGAGPGFIVICKDTLKR